MKKPKVTCINPQKITSKSYQNMQEHIIICKNLNMLQDHNLSKVHLILQGFKRIFKDKPEHFNSCCANFKNPVVVLFLLLLSTSPPHEKNVLEFLHNAYVQLRM